MEKAEDRFVRPVLYLALGDSVTQGFREHDSAGSLLYHQDVYHAQFQRQYKYIKSFLVPSCSVINAGVVYDTGRPRSFRARCDIFRSRLGNDQLWS